METQQVRFEHPSLNIAIKIEQTAQCGGIAYV